MLENPEDERASFLDKIAKNYRSESRKCLWQQPALSEKQERALKNLEKALVELRCWDGDTPTDESEESHLRDVFAKYERALMRAIRAGLLHHPIVRDWLAARRSLGDWDYLRSFRLSLERGVKKTIPKEGFFIAFEAQGLIEQGHGPEAIRKTIIRKLKFSTHDDRQEWEKWFDLSSKDIEPLINRLKCSRQNFYRWLRRLKIL